MYIQNIVWEFAKHKSDQYRLLDVRYSTVKNLILADCKQLIKFILFGDEQEGKEKECETRHIPKSISWPGKEFIKDNDLDKERIIPENIDNELELAIYHCKGEFQFMKLLVQVLILR